MKHLLFAALAASVAAAQSLESSYQEAANAQKRLTPPTCWTRAVSPEADAAGMPLVVCLGALKPAGKTVEISGSAVLAGGAQRETLSGERPLSAAGSRAWVTVFHWEAGKGELDEESVVQVEFKLDGAGAPIPGSEKLIAFHQCPERGCAYACGMTTVVFTPAAAPKAP